MKKLIGLLLATAFIVTATTGCESLNRFTKDVSSNVSGGMNRKITAYDYNGNMLYEYTGKVDIQMNESKVLFDTEDGKRVILYNAIVITEEQ